MAVAVERDAFGFHLFDAPSDHVFFHFEIGNAVNQQAAGARIFLINVDVMARARELLRSGEACRTRANDRDLFSGFCFGRLRQHPALFKSAVCYCAFDRFNRHRLVVDVQSARGFAWRWANAARDFWEVIGRVQVLRRLFPVAAIDEIVPIGDLVIDGAARMAKRNAAIHTAARLLFEVALWQRHHKFVIVLHALFDRLVLAVGAVEFQKSCRLAHVVSCSCAAQNANIISWSLFHIAHLDTIAHWA